MDKFAERLKDLREEKELSQRELAKLSGVNRTSIQKWEQDTREPSVEAVITLAAYFGVSTDYLLGVVD